MNDYFFGTLEPFSWFFQDVYRGREATWMRGGFFWRVLGQQKLLPGIHLRKLTWNSKTGWFVDVSPFPRCIFWFHVSFWGYITEGQATHQRDPSKQPLDENDSRRRKESRSISWSFNVFFSQRKIFRAGCLRVWPHMDPFLSWRVPKMMAHCARTVWRLWCLRANYNMANPAIWQIFFVCPFQQATFLFGLQSRTLHFDLGRFRGGKILAGMSLIGSIFWYLLPELVRFFTTLVSLGITCVLCISRKIWISRKNGCARKSGNTGIPRTPFWKVLILPWDFPEGPAAQNGVDLWRGKHVAFFFFGVLKKVACEQKTTFFLHKKRRPQKIIWEWVWCFSCKIVSTNTPFDEPDCWGFCSTAGCVVTFFDLLIRGVSVRLQWCQEVKLARSCNFLCHNRGAL